MSTAPNRCPAWIFAVAAAGTALGASGEASAQNLGNGCDPRSFRVIDSRQIAPGQRVTWIGRPDVVCADGVQIRADSAVVWEAAGRTEFLGRFRYIDPQREVESVNADYFQRERRLFAVGQARLRTLDDEMEVRGETVNLFEAEGAGDDRLVASGQPAYARIQSNDSANVSAPVSPYEITALELRFEGERFLYADGDVEVDRDSLHASTRSLSFDRTQGTVILAGDARVQSGATEFEGRTIRLALPGDELTSMVIQEDGRLISDELDLSGEEIRVDFEDGVMRHLLATRQVSDPSGRAVTPPAADSAGVGATASPGSELPRPQAFAEDFFLVADSLEVMAPEGFVETVYAYGRARGESRGREPDTSATSATDDGVQTPVSEAAQAVADTLGIDLEVLKRDWIEGDTIVAMFRRVDEPLDATSGDGTTGSEYVLDRLVAAGNARTLYRSPPETQSAEADSVPLPSRERWSISYLLADQIILTLVEGQVEHVQAEGAVSGLQLEPDPLAAPEGTADPGVDP